jgi:hypothetical protein
MTDRDKKNCLWLTDKIQSSLESVLPRANPIKPKIALKRHIIFRLDYGSLKLYCNDID